MKEQVFLGGVPVVGFGDAGTVNNTSLAAPLVGFSLGGLAGAAIGAIVGKGTGAAVGAIIGGIGGGVITYAATAKAAQATSSSSVWRRLSVGDPVAEGQPIFVTISSPDGLAPEVVASISKSLSYWPGSTTRSTYPPGSQTPSDVPADDTRGPGAYRFTTISGISDRYSPEEISKAMPPVPLTIEAWVKR